MMSGCRKLTNAFPGGFRATRSDCGRAWSVSRLLYARSAGSQSADFAFADDVSSTDRFRYTSDSDDSDCVARSPDEPFYVVRTACENRSFLAKGRRHHNGVNDIRRFWSGLKAVLLRAPRSRQEEPPRTQSRSAGVGLVAGTG